MWPRQFRALKIVHKFLVYTSLGLSLILSLVMLISILDYYDIWARNSLFDGASFLSPLWLLFPIILLAVVLYLLNRKIFSLIVLIIYCVYFLIIGDASLKFLSGYNVLKSEEKKLSILSVNVRYYSYGIDQIFNFIDSVDADIVLLSENTLPSDSITIFSNIGEKYYVCSGKKYETAILSKYPILLCREIEFPTHQASLSGSNNIDSLYKNPKRSFTHIRFNFNEREIDALSVRLIAGRPKSNKIKDQIEWGKYLIEKQTEEIQMLVNYLNTLERPVVFGGDFNAPPNAKVMRPLYKIAEDAARSQTFIPGPTFRTEFPVTRLDYIFTMNGLKTVNYSRLKVNVSDHLPIYGEFLLIRRNTGDENSGRE